MLKSLVWEEIRYWNRFHVLILVHTHTRTWKTFNTSKWEYYVRDRITRSELLHETSTCHF